jgi:uncharacterized membrane protein HdeD (DUF308 family)
VTQREPERARTWLVGYLVARGGVLALLGAFLLLRPHDTVDALATLAGVTLLAFGAIDLVAAIPTAAGAGRRPLLLARGGVTVAVGLFAVVLTDVAVTTLAILLGMHLVLTGGVALLVGLTLRDQVRHWWLTTIRSALFVVAGLISVLWPSITLGALALIYGFQWLLGGAFSVVTAMDVGRTA